MGHFFLFLLYMVLGVWVGCVGDRLDLLSWFGCLRWGCEGGWMKLLRDEEQRIPKLSLPYLPALGKAPSETLHHSSDSYTYRNHLKYLYNIVCCVESVETKPPFPWVSCQSPKIVPRARTFPLWYFAFPCCTELGEGKENSLTPIMLHPDLSCPQFIASLYFLSHPFTCLNLGEKQGKRKERGGTGTSFQLGRQLPAFCVVSSSKVSWGISK